MQPRYAPAQACRYYVIKCHVKCARANVYANNTAELECILIWPALAEVCVLRVFLLLVV